MYGSELTTFCCVRRIFCCLKMSNFQEHYLLFSFFKFCFQWEKTFSVTFEMLKQAFGTESTGWTSKGLNTAKLRLKMTHILDDFPHKKVNNMLKKFMKSHF